MSTAWTNAERRASLIETLEILADRALMAVLRESLADIAAGRVISHAEVRRQLLENPDA